MKSNTSRRWQLLKTLGYTIFIKLVKSSISQIEESIKEYTPEIKDAYWLKHRDMNASFYELYFENISLDQFKDIFLRVAKNSLTEQINVNFQTKKDCFSLLQDKGFVKYEESEYADFKIEDKNIYIVVLKEKDYILKIKRLNDEKTVNIPYFFNLINRVKDIIHGEDIKKWVDGINQNEMRLYWF